ncbi:hypothetical protein ACIF70_33015 [Actinacidiphila glaucinigra]|uniref:hypothetical protein n=1 Tax=Actinacidiphila glaucinigra TaxID=235986 RepID=UPI0037C7874F
MEVVYGFHLMRAFVQGDANHVIPPTVLEALNEAGVFRLLTPQEVRRPRDGPSDAPRGVGDPGLADCSAARNGMIISVPNRLACLFPDKAQEEEEAFGADPNARVTGVAAPTGIGRRVPGGKRVSGRWSYNSGAPYATWAAVGALLKDEHDAVVDQALVLIPAANLIVENTWHTAGMRGIASNTLIGGDVFVPEHRITENPR